MSDRATIVRYVHELQGKRTGYRYRDLARILDACGCTMVHGEGTSHRSWQYPGQSIPTLPNPGSGDLKPGYIRMLAHPPATRLTLPAGPARLRGA